MHGQKTLRQTVVRT